MEVMDKNSDEMACMEKIRQCLTILEYIEEEFQVSQIAENGYVLCERIVTWSRGYNPFRSLR